MNNWGEGIRIIDDQVLRLLSLRAIFAAQAVEQQRRPFSTEYERNITNRLVGQNQTTLFPDARLRTIYRTLHHEYRAFQEDIMQGRD